MKKFIAYALIFSIAVGTMILANSYAERSLSVEYTAPQHEAQTVEREETEVQKARKMLEEATAKLDAEEASLLGQIADLESRIEEINAIRSSF